MSASKLAKYYDAVGLRCYFNKTPLVTWPWTRRARGDFHKVRRFGVIEGDSSFDTDVAIPLRDADPSLTTSSSSTDGQHVGFSLVKCGLETEEAVRRLSSATNVTGWRFAGKKDRFSVSKQRMSLPMEQFRKLLEQLPKLDIHNDAGRLLKGQVRLGDAHALDRPISLGDHAHNAFDIAIELRGEDFPCDAARERVEKGILNYYGLQRFGNPRQVSHHLGKYLLREEWDAAVDLWLGSEGHRGAVHDSLRTRDLQLLPRGMRSEHVLLSTPGTNREKILSLPLQDRLFRIQAYMSYAWNMALSHRVEAQGTESSQEGDLVLEKGQAVYGAAGRPLTETLLPMVGPTTLFPQNDTGKFLHQLVQSDLGGPMPAQPVCARTKPLASEQPERMGTTLQDGYFSEKNEVVRFGAYRAMVVVPQQVSVDVVEMSRQPCVRLRFVLPKGAYATNVLREVFGPEHITPWQPPA
eukprot:GEMP01029066.1.p1 GENE.GEMP01029066.1~~GEMP01029066.1.p1  ORF type:complete len:466 (+),score=113.38 GEMP01029066.1:64-1461(+)